VIGALGVVLMAHPSAMQPLMRKFSTAASSTTRQAAFPSGAGHAPASFIGLSRG
jgi:hypothetical protein